MRIHGAARLGKTSWLYIQLRAKLQRGLGSTAFTRYVAQRGWLMLLLSSSPRSTIAVKHHGLLGLGEDVNK